MSIDRVFAVAFPLFYVQINFHLYIICHLIIIFIFAILMFYIQIMSVFEHPNYPVTGNLADIFGLPAYFDTRIAFSLFLIFSIFLHLLVAILAKYKGDMANEKMRKLHLSLSLIIFVNIGGYFTFNIAILITKLVIPMFPVMIWYLSAYFGILLNLSSAVNAPILYINSSDYNNAYKKEFNKIKLFFNKYRSNINKTNRIRSINNTTMYP
ncbi:hypothetical protein Mgra_00003021 [Meloidogyne graminicola]|uniref:G-protein coupled receptors family 1 profile domain-containing protein n=1 Tax=Meloidogyne graminicola TaxID=189291 RepID=A0A8S9ZVB0_9BILA|nr:hypothetical protein Mgra_00003021 [Meloidogyne graminicola]